MEPEQPEYVDTTSVDCDGGGGPLGHPMVFLKIDATGEVVCPYCSRRFVLSEDASTSSGH
ncbi:MAG: zinc-finger domain-containing protein [Alphaproteobacteria bacterium]